MGGGSVPELRSGRLLRSRKSLRDYGAASCLLQRLVLYMKERLVTMTDSEILDLLYEDRDRGMSALIDTYGTLVYQLVSDILREVGSDDEIFDCISDSFEAFYNNIDDVDLSQGSLKGYLGVIAHRRAVNLYFTLNPDDERVFSEYTVEEMSEALRNAEPEFMPEVPHRIKLDCFIDEISPVTEEVSEEFRDDFTEEVAEEFSEELPDETQEETISEADDEIFEEPVIERRKRRGVNRLFKVMAMAAVLVLVIIVAVIAIDKLSVPKYEGTTTTAPTTAKNNDDPLFSAILSGNEKLIESLITNSLLLTEDMVSFALENAGKLSYETIRHITEAVNEKFGSTGLDSLLEGAILGDSEKVMDSLEGKDEMEMTPSERLAFFFSGAFGNSEVIEEFIEKGFDATIKDSSGKTVFDIAGIYGNSDILNWRSQQ